ncbi:MAG: C10 family peptidase [Bacteroidetes bacterium]|nr:C10 family peptidase [Bacteroidota bacterium]
MKKIIFFLFFVSFINMQYAAIVPIETAKKLALNFYAQKFKEANSQIITKDIFISESYTISDNNIAVFYIFNIADYGYILISGENNTTPILAYSFESTYHPNNVIPAFKMWMDAYKKSILYARKNNLSANNEIKNRWLSITNTNNEKNSSKSVSPFIHSKWDQDNNFNIKCPADAAGPGGHCVTGCVATCLGQLMYYYRFPSHGKGNYSYTHNVYGNLSADYENTYYKWDAMCDVPTKPNLAISELISQSGIGVDMHYSANSSGMYNHSAAYVLKTYFKYSPAVRYVFRDSTNLRWDSLMITQLDKKMPLYYAGWSVPNVDGHAFVCDGYQDTTYFHFNFGWSGVSDGYFYLNALSPGNNNFNLAQELIINIYPDTALYTYPSYCGGQKTLTATEGSIEDGSGPINNYQANSNCIWLITPVGDSISSLNFNFSSLQTKLNHGIVKIYKGINSSAPLMGSYSGDSIPTSVSFNGKEAFVSFTSDNDSLFAGFFINYKATTPDYCSSYKYLNTTSGTFTDGSGNKKYNPNTYCTWKISPNTPTTNITLHFINFTTEANKDILRVKTFFPDSVLATFSGSNIPQDFTVNSDEAIIEWISDYENEFAGWEISYTSSNVGINAITGIENIFVYPNPVDKTLNIMMNITDKQDVMFDIYSMEGKLIYSENRKNLFGKIKEEINLNNIKSGIYLLQLSNSKKEILRQKIIVK